MSNNQDIKIILNLDQCLRIDYTLCNIRPVFYFDTNNKTQQQSNKQRPDDLILDSSKEYISFKKHTDEILNNKHYKYAEYTYKNGVYGLLPGFTTTERNLNSCCFKRKL